MRTEIVEFIQNQRINADARMTSYIKDPLGTLYPSRTIFIKAKKYLNDFLEKKETPRWLIIPGLRGVGKTTLLAQLYMWLGRQPQEFNTLFLSLNEVVDILKSDLKEALETFEYLLGESFEKQTKQTFIFLDEVQYDSSWAKILKSLYDRSRNVFIFCTGSSAISLQSNIDSIRRSSKEKLYPCSFTEYVMLFKKIYPIKDLKSKLRSALWQSSSAKETYEKLKLIEPEVNKYWSKVDKTLIRKYLRTGTIPFTMLFQDEYKAYELVLELLDKITKIDVPSIKKFKNETLESSSRLLLLLSESDTKSLHKIAKDLGINIKTIMDFINVLEKAELLIRIYPHGSVHKKVRKPAKYLFMSPTIRAAYLNLLGGETLLEQNKGKLFEDAVGLYLYKEFIVPGAATVSYDPNQNSADFIIRFANDKAITLEVGLGSKGCIQTRNTMKRTASKYGLVVSSNELALVEEDIVKVPIGFFLLA